MSTPFPPSGQGYPTPPDSRSATPPQGERTVTFPELTNALAPDEAYIINNKEYGKLHELVGISRLSGHDGIGGTDPTVRGYLCAFALVFSRGQSYPSPSVPSDLGPQSSPGDISATMLSNSTNEGQKLYTLYVAINGDLDNRDDKFEEDLTSFIMDRGCNNDHDKFEIVVRHCHHRIDVYIEKAKDALEYRDPFFPYRNRLVIKEIKSFVTQNAGNHEALQDLYNLQKNAMKSRNQWAHLDTDWTRRNCATETTKAVVKVSELLQAWDQIIRFKRDHLQDEDQFRIELVGSRTTDEVNLEERSAPRDSSTTRGISGGTVHCEMKLVHHFLNHRQKNEVFHDFVGCSKLCCVCCHLVLNMKGFNGGGCHRKVYGNWDVAEVAENETTDLRNLDLLVGFLEQCRQTGPELRKTFARPESPVGHTVWRKWTS